MKLENMTCCSWHKPRNAIVDIRTGKIVPKEAIDRIPEGPAKDTMLYSGNMCDPCAKRFTEGKWEPMAEDIVSASPPG